MLPLISICIPVFNEEKNIEALYARIAKVRANMASKCRLEIIFTDNHSTDRTWQVIKKLSEKDETVKCLRFSKNFGFQRSIFANYLHASGDAVLQIDADLQDPPELLEEFFDKWRAGYHVVYGIRRSRPESPILRAYRWFGYFVINKLSSSALPMNAGDFRLVDRKVLEVLLSYRDHSPYLRGAISSLGFNQVGIPYDRDARLLGESKFNVIRLFGLGLSAVFNHSTAPLRLASFLGLLILVLAFFGAIYYVMLRMLDPSLPQGMASIHVIALFGIGLNALLLGIIGEYLLRIHSILRGEPIAVVQDYINVDKEDLKL